MAINLDAIDIESDPIHSGDFRQGGSLTESDEATITWITSDDVYQTRLALYSNDNAETIDFSQNSIVLIDGGLKRSGGYTLTLAEPSTSLVSGQLTIHFNINSPGENCNVTTALTNPYAFYLVAIENADFDVTLSPETIDCS